MDAARQAIEAWQTLRDTCIRFDLGTAAALEGPGTGRAPLWPLSQVLAASIDVASLTGDYVDTLALVRGLEAFRAGDGFAPRPGKRRRFFDDNAWIGLAMVQLHRQTGDPASLAQAERVFGFVATGQADDGGVRWRERTGSLHTCSTAPAAELALHLYRLTGNPARLAFAQRAVAWLDRTMRLPSGLVADHMSRGRIDKAVRSYNQGASLGALALLARAEDESAPAAHAMELAAASLGHFTGDRLWREPPVFNAVWLRNLLALDAVAPVTGLDEALDAYLGRALAEARDPATGLFTAGGIGSYDGTPAIDHAGMVQLLALRAWPPEGLVDVT